MTELTAQTLDDAIDRYLRSKSKGGTDSGTYHQSAQTALDRGVSGLTGLMSIRSLRRTLAHA